MTTAITMGFIDDYFDNVPSSLPAGASRSSTRFWIGTSVTAMVLAVSVIGARALLRPTVLRNGRRHPVLPSSFWTRCLVAAGGAASGGEMATLPPDVVKYGQVPSGRGDKSHFTASTVPKGLLKDHTTKAGTWGVIRVERGSLLYCVQEPAPHQFELVAPARGIIEPTIRHHVQPLSDDVQFVVEFYRKPGTGPVDEPREGL